MGFTLWQTPGRGAGPLEGCRPHKLNVFPWHLVDDQGWRLEIKKYPKLTSVKAELQRFALPKPQALR